MQVTENGYRLNANESYKSVQGNPYKLEYTHTVQSKPHLCSINTVNYIPMQNEIIVVSY